jgi:hypothetical protein
LVSGEKGHKGLRARRPDVLEDRVATEAVAPAAPAGGRSRPAPGRAGSGLAPGYHSRSRSLSRISFIFCRNILPLEYLAYSLSALAAIFPLTASFSK